MHSVEETSVESAAGGEFRVRVLMPIEEPRGIIVYFHGGGWVIGGLDDFDVLGRRLAAQSGATVVLVDYRLAPEYPYPIPGDDAWSATRWAAENRHRFARPDAPIVLAGDSAGGNLAIVTALRSRSEGPDIAATLLVYPVTDSDFDRPSYVAPENQLMLSKLSMEWFFQHYVQGGDPGIPEISPLRSSDLAGFPPTALVTAEHDPLRDEGEAFGDALRGAGVEVIHRRFEGQMHGFFTILDVLPGGQDALDWLVEFLDTRVFDA